MYALLNFCFFDSVFYPLVVLALIVKKICLLLKFKTSLKTHHIFWLPLHFTLPLAIFSSFKSSSTAYSLSWSKLFCIKSSLDLYFAALSFFIVCSLAFVLLEYALTSWSSSSSSFAPFISANSFSMIWLLVLLLLGFLALLAYLLSSSKSNSSSGIALNSS